MKSYTVFYKALSESLQKGNMNKPQIIVKTVIDFINAGSFAIGEAIPSIHGVAKFCDVAGETVRQAYNILKQKGLLDSRRGKSYYVICDHYENVPNIFLMFNFFGTPHKVETLNGIRAGVGDKAKLNFFSHYKDPEIFVKTLEAAKGRYDYYVVMPLRNPKCAQAMANIDQSKLLIIDIDIDYPNKTCPRIIQNFNENFLKMLNRLAPDIKKYKGFDFTMVLNQAPEEHRIAFDKFCKEQHLKGKFFKNITEADVKPKTVWMLFDDSDLVTVIKKSQEMNLEMLKDYAVISYNDIPMKRIIGGGITTISIDFFDLGKRVAKQILAWDETHVETVETFLIKGSTL